VTLISTVDNRALLFPRRNGNEATVTSTLIRFEPSRVSRKVTKDLRGEIKATCNLKERKKEPATRKQEDLLGTSNEREMTRARARERGDESSFYRKLRFIKIAAGLVVLPVSSPARRIISSPEFAAVRT